MFLVRLHLVSVLCYSAVLVNGQCTMSNCRQSTLDPNEGVVRNLEKYDHILRMLQMMNETFSSQLNAIRAQMNESLQYIKSQDHCRDNQDICDCSTIKANGYTSSGVYRIYVDHQLKRYYKYAYCDMSTTTGKWTVFQRRKDGSEDFFRGWNDYTNGFGNPYGEFWLGNDFLYLLTSKKNYRLRIDFEDFEGGRRYAEYSNFGIDSAEQKYRITFGSYSGDAGDSLSRSKGYRFTTKDADNDGNLNENCSIRRRAACWYKDCSDSNLNGLYYRGTYTSCSSCIFEGFRWDSWRGDQYSLKMTEMKISPI